MNFNPESIIKSIEQSIRNIDMQTLVPIIVIGGLSGWIASAITRSSNGIITNIILGIVGAFIGKYLFGILGITIAAGILGTIISSVSGAVILILILRLIF